MPCEPLRSVVNADICVIGGGVTGLSTALYVKKLDPTASVALLEAEVAGYGASGRNAGQLIVAFGRGDFTQQVRRYGTKNLGLAYELRGSCLRLIENLLQEYHIDCDYVPSDILQMGCAPMVTVL